MSRNRKQIVLSEPGKIFKEKYLSPKGKKLLTKKNAKEIWKKYGKKRYISNTNAVFVKIIKHNI